MAPHATYRFTSQPTAKYKNNTPHHFSVEVDPAEPYEGGKWEVALLDVTFPKRRNPVPVVNTWSSPVYEKLKQIHSGILYSLKDQPRVHWSHVIDYFKAFNENYLVFRIEFLYFFKYVEGRDASSSAYYKWDGKGVTVKDVRDRLPINDVTGVDFIKWCIDTAYKRIVEDSPVSPTVGGQPMDKCVSKEFCPSFEWDGEDLISNFKLQTLPLGYQPNPLTEANAKTLRVLWDDSLARNFGWCDSTGSHVGVNASYNTSWAQTWVSSSGSGPGERSWNSSRYPGNTHSGNALYPPQFEPPATLRPGTEYRALALYGRRKYSMLRGSDGLGSTFRDSVAFQKESHNGQWMIHFSTSYEWRFRDINAAFFQAMGNPVPPPASDVKQTLDDYENPDFHIEVQSNIVEGGVLAHIPYERYSEKQYQHYEKTQEDWKPVSGFTLGFVNIALRRTDTFQFYEEYQKKDVTFTPMFTSICLGFRKV